MESCMSRRDQTRLHHSVACDGSSLCKVISGRLFNLTATTDEPAPTEVYPDILWYTQGPAPKRRGRVESRVIGIEPGKQIWPPCVCPPSSRPNPACAAWR